MKLPAFVLVVFLSSASSAYARELTHHVQLVSSAPTQHGSFTVPRFDPGFGRLQRARIELGLAVQGAIGVENVEPVPATVGVELLEELRLAVPGESTALSVPLQALASLYLLDFDGSIDFTGSSGQIVRAAVGSQRELEIVSALGRFVATPSEASLELALDFVGVLRFSEGSAHRAALEYVADLRLTYVYEPHDAGRPRRVASAAASERRRIEADDRRTRIEAV